MAENLQSLQNGVEHHHQPRPPPPIMPKPKRERSNQPNPLPLVPASPSTSSSETPLSPPWSLGPPHLDNSDGHRRPMPPPRSSSIPHSEGDEALPQSVIPPTHVYPSPPYTIDSMHSFSPPAASPVRQAKPLQALSLQELVDKHSRSFPLQIKVLHGFSGQTSQLTLSSGDYYNVHLVKRQEVVVLSDKVGFSYTIPLNSSLQFGLVYSENADFQKDLDTHIFEKVADLLAVSPLPRVASATRDVKGSDERSTISANEILVIKRVIKPKLRKKSLEVLSLKTQSTKILPQDCEGFFTLSPRRNQIYLLELVKCIPKALPCEAVIFLNGEISSNLQRVSPSLLNAVVTLTEQKTETSLIASSVTYTGSVEGGGNAEPQVSESLVDIPVDDRLRGVEVAIVDTSDFELQEVLNHNTRNLFENFDSTRVQSWYDAPNNNVFLTQSLLYATIGRGSEGVGVQVDTPLAAYSKESPPPSSADLESIKTGEEALYESVYNPSMDDTNFGAADHQSFITSSDEFATQYERPHLSQPYNISVTSAGVFSPNHYQPKVSEARAEVYYDPLPPIPRVAPASVMPPVPRSLTRSHSQGVLAAIDLLPDCYEDMHPRTTSPISSSVLPGSSSQQSNGWRLQQLIATTNSLKASISDLTHRMSYMESHVREVAERSAAMKTLMESMSALTVQSSQLRGGLERAGGRAEREVSTANTAADKSEAQLAKEKRNIQYLENLGVTQVSKLCKYTE